MTPRTTEETASSARIASNIRAVSSGSQAAQSSWTLAERGLRMAGISLTAPPESAEIVTNDRYTNTLDGVLRPSITFSAARRASLTVREGRRYTRVVLPGRKDDWLSSRS